MNEIDAQYVFKVALNSLANYLAGAWKNGEGCLVCQDRVALDADNVRVSLPHSSFYST